MAEPKNDAKLAASRHAARLFLARGVGGTSGDDIAAAAGVSTRTLWRYFRSKENCVEPLLAASWKRFANKLRRWPRARSIEAHLAECFDLEKMSREEIDDALLIVMLIARLPEDPALRPTWLLSYHGGEAEMAAIVADRLGRSANDFEVRLCAAAAMAAVRTVDETISRAAVLEGHAFTTAEVVAQMSRAIRSVSHLPFCDPVAAQPFGGAREAP